MTRTTHVCAGCHAELHGKDDLDQEIGDVYSKWRCKYCGTRVPGVVAEKLKHQT